MTAIETRCQTMQLASDIVQGLACSHVCISCSSPRARRTPRGLDTATKRTSMIFESGPSTWLQPSHRHLVFIPVMLIAMYCILVGRRSVRTVLHARLHSNIPYRNRIPRYSLNSIVPWPPSVAIRVPPIISDPAAGSALLTDLARLQAVWLTRILSCSNCMVCEFFRKTLLREAWVVHLVAACVVPIEKPFIGQRPFRNDDALTDTPWRLYPEIFEYWLIQLVALYILCIVVLQTKVP